MSNSILGRKAKLIRLHVGTHITGLGGVGPVVDGASIKLKNFTLTIVDKGVLLKHDQGEALLPDSNIISIELYPE